MNPDTPFTTIGDAPVEARIVAWVLGEASAFEAAELERLCEERPELLVFRRRMRALHGLLTEAEKPDELWKLPPEKRRAVEVILGEDKPIRLEMAKEKRIRHSGRRAFLAIAACLILLVVIGGLTAPMVIRQRKKSDIAEARSEEMQRELANRQLAELNKAVRDQEDKVEERSKVLATIERNREAKFDDRLAANEPREAAIKRGLDAQDYVDAKRELVSDQQLLQAMKLKQIEETIANRIASAEVGEKAAGEDKLSQSKDRSLASNSPRTRRLETTLPKELIEGTPKPINVPNLEAPANGPAGSTTWSMANSSKKPAPPAQPSSSRAKVVTAAPASETAIPAPDLALTAPSLDFGDSDDFGAGWGGGGGSATEASGGGIVAGGRLEIQREFRNSTESQAPELEGAVDSFSVNGSAFPAPPANPLAFGANSSDMLAGQETKREKSMIQEGDKSGYLFKGMDLGKDKFVFPGDAEALAQAVRDQEDKVEEKRKVLATIVRNKAIIYKGQDSFYNQGGVDEDMGARSALQTFHQLEQEKIQLESQISSLLKYDSDQLIVYAAGLNLPDNIIRELYPKYQEAKRQLEGLKIRGPGDQHPDVQATVDQVEKMKRQLDEGVINLRKTLQAQLDLANNRLKSVEARKNETREEAIKRGLDAQDYADAKKEFERDLEILQQMKLKQKAASMKAKSETPKPDLSKLMEEIAASEEPYSTFSLNISDASFQVARAALAKGEQPDPAGIKVEQFYNAVDYGDPAPSAGEPVAVAIEQCTQPVIPGRNLVRVALKTAAGGRSASQPLRLTLLVDQSGSMVREDRRAAMDKALAGLAELLTKNDLVTVIGFARTPHLLADGMTGDKVGKLAGLVNQAASEGGTNLEEAIKLGEQVAVRQKLAGAQNRIVLFTDGAANLGNADPDRLAEHVKQLRQKGIAFDIAGIAADGLNDELLGELARNGNGRYYVVGKGADGDFAKQLAGAFRPAAENVKVQVRFNPERVGRYKLIGFEKDRLKTEDFRNDKVDAAELAAEEAGVAIYQVEPKPEGHGELGEVSVRFRDTASGEMVERTWTIPHEPGAPAIDRATPSMQLAVLAMLAGEKLKGGPLADAIDFKQLTAPRANVKRYFGSNTRVAEVLRMVEMLK